MATHILKAPMTTQYYFHPACLKHETGQFHPERPERLVALQEALAADGGFAALRRLEAPLGHVEQIARVHPRSYIDGLRALRPESGLINIDADTSMSPGTWDAALYGVGAATAAVDAVIGGVAKNAFCASRPPGHHAETARAMGFCLFNNVAIAARHGQVAHGLARVAIVDFDVHHGNGTQDIFWDDASVFYASTHQMPLFPGSGALNEEGEHGTIVNAPLRAGDAGAAFRAAFAERIIPALHNFAPELVIISAGFDAHKRDPLAQINLSAEDFTWVSEALLQVADTHAQGRLVSILEGGYDLEGLKVSAAAHIAALMGA